jgi:hypothetical protein
MPNAFIRKLAKGDDNKFAKLEKIWARAKATAQKEGKTGKDIYIYATGVLKKVASRSKTLQERTELYLGEGIRFFKTSAKLKKIIAYIREAMSTSETQEEAKKYLRMISRIEDIASRFEKMEGEFSSSDTSGPRKEKIKKRYEKLSKDLEEILKHSPADWKAYFKSIGAYGAIQALTMLILWKMFDFNIYDSPFFEYLTAKVGIAVPALLASWKIGDMSYADDISELLSKLEKKFGNSTN